MADAARSSSLNRNILHDASIVRHRRVVRGGRWIDDAQYARSAFRYCDDPGYRGGYLGFRAARSSVRPD